MEQRKSQTKSKERVRDHGEVFTAEREVKAMCDLVKEECQRIDSRFLEPACGDGNFLAEILERKLGAEFLPPDNKSAKFNMLEFLSSEQIKELKTSKPEEFIFYDSLEPEGYRKDFKVVKK